VRTHRQRSGRTAGSDARSAPPATARGEDQGLPESTLLSPQARRWIHLVWAARPFAFARSSCYSITRRISEKCGRECLVMQRKKRRQPIRFSERQKTKKHAPDLRPRSGVVIPADHEFCSKGFGYLVL